MDGPGLAWPIHFTLNSPPEGGVGGLRQPQFSDFVKTVGTHVEQLTSFWIASIL